MNQWRSLVDEITRRQAEWTSSWHEQPTPPQTRLPWTWIEQNHRMNFDLWHEEDIARRDDLGPERVCHAKRAIDRCNQARNDAIEQMDSWFTSQLPSPPPGAPLHSETPGMMMDRLSILALKLYHMRVEADRVSATEEQRSLCREKCRILEEQTRDLRDCLQMLLEESQNGARRFKLYRQFKMYNDSALNPQLYARAPEP